ncbi:probable DEAD-box ATP-dependent RNA helicase 48 [Mercurialis annua]|uniref:probable DEAD-box ATP-dependent RNA helicase 48 n=1 Tax=Mercurialis annua TaxID=3986 RepID=UPI0021603AB0|nr:probable DEAD-box ATP-dependent RNA helicase 48 [Mercurialis annua]XP_050227426.1 probable DEAD-box ATP-dependent RNA helicase 48 [Mercurialis annua]XP_050227427.1 probable DEAD-box ATP-dependent RNA helicase 48 [Mercurialis annua]XP_050227428.1 probable DEAD-box ATP-dependent RNA helicase 48 [Mercurialis annua]XP_050227429.1 probable DEAD-box ATP-dependent RNA helicase 48 [Mercurialis annua]
MILVWKGSRKRGRSDSPASFLNPDKTPKFISVSSTSVTLLSQTLTMYSSMLLLHRSKTLMDHLTTRKILTRFMGGGPRTFPGGLNKWQWKRLHERRAKEKEKGLLEQEKQLYQARIRSQIRSKIAGKPDPDSNSSNFTAMSPTDHIKALADRFMKAGAEDLWNEDDGPLKAQWSVPNRPSGSIGSRQLSGSISSPIDLRKLMLESRNQNFESSGNDCYKYTKSREFSVKSFNSGQKQSSLVIGSDSLKKSRETYKRPRRFRGNESSSSEDDDSDNYGFESNDEMVRKGRNVRGILGGRAALRNHDVKTTKRVPLKDLEREIDYEKEVELIRQELGKRKNMLDANEGEKSEAGEEKSVLSQKRFDECGLSPFTVKALTAAGYVQMTTVQEATLSICLEGKDAMVKSKTGTGKSAAFLLPAIETVLKAKNSTVKPRVSPIYVLILCPTRELASQIAAEANAMLKYHDGIGVQTLVGGTRFKDDQKRLVSDPCQMIVATPGRLLDHIENKGGLSVHLMGLKMLILDEADHLLDLGFRKDVEKIVDCLPRKRHSLMFSATIPKEVRRMSQLVLNKEHAFIDTVGMGCVETPEKVKQSFLVVPHELHFQLVHHLLKDHILQTPDYKIIVFCTTGMVTSLIYQLLRELKMNVKEIHTRKPQLYRTRVSDEFKESKRSILVTSDVSARGMNYPDVTLVIQVGLPTDREQYIHRLGRTGRVGNEGEGILLLAPWENYFLEELEDLPLNEIPVPNIDPEDRFKVEHSMSKIDSSVKEAAYHAWLGYYNSIRRIGRDKTTLVGLASTFCESIGLQRPPPIFRKTALKMGLKDIPGIRIRA